MWDGEGSGTVPLPNMVADFRDTNRSGMMRFTRTTSSCSQIKNHPYIRIVAHALS
jgi:hypothetical protein